jgi:hypothetical protein
MVLRTKKQAKNSVCSVKWVLSNSKMEMQCFASVENKHLFLNSCKAILGIIAVSLTLLNLTCAFLIFAEVC